MTISNVESNKNPPHYEINDISTETSKTIAELCKPFAVESDEVLQKARHFYHSPDLSVLSAIIKVYTQVAKRLHFQTNDLFALQEDISQWMRDIPDPRFIETLHTATSNNEWEVILLYLRGQREIPKNALREAFLVAVRNNSVEVMELLQEDGKIPENFLGGGFLLAIRDNYIGFVKLSLQNKTVSEILREVFLFFYEEASSPYFSQTPSLLDCADWGGPSREKQSLLEVISKTELNKLFINKKKAQEEDFLHLEFVKLFLQRKVSEGIMARKWDCENEPAKCYSEDLRIPYVANILGELLWFSGQEGHVEIFQLLSQNIGEEILLSAFEHCYYNEAKEETIFLKKHMWEEVGSDALGRALVWVAEKENLGIAKLFLLSNKSKEIPKEVINRVITKSGLKEYHNIMYQVDPEKKEKRETNVFLKLIDKAKKHLVMK